MNYQIKQMSEDDMEEVLSWHYEGEYQVYDCQREQLKQNDHSMFNPDVRQKEFWSVYQDEVFMGYFRLRQTQNGCMMGIGIKPSECGKGHSRVLLPQIVTLARELYPQDKLALIVRPFNQRAIRAYERAGFCQTERTIKQTPFGEIEFITMELEPCQE